MAVQDSCLEKQKLGVMGNPVGLYPFGGLLAPCCQLWQQISSNGSRVLKVPSLALQSAIFKAMVVSVFLGDDSLMPEGEILLLRKKSFYPPLVKSNRIGMLFAAFCKRRP